MVLSFSYGPIACCVSQWSVDFHTSPGAPRRHWRCFGFLSSTKHENFHVKILKISCQYGSLRKTLTNCKPILNCDLIRGC